MATIEKDNPLPNVIIQCLNLNYGGQLPSLSRLSEIPNAVKWAAGDIADPLHILLAGLACEETELHCSKMRFAAAAVELESGLVVATGFNARIRPTMPEYSGRGAQCPYPGCVRLNVSSRTSPLDGDCEHAIWVMINNLEASGRTVGELAGSNPRLVIYEAGFYRPGNLSTSWLPWVAGESYYTCLYCDNRLIGHGIEKVRAMKKLPTDTAPRWTEIDVKESQVHDAQIAQRGYKEP